VNEAFTLIESSPFWGVRRMCLLDYLLDKNIN
jgi:hypothetical protein